MAFSKSSDVDFGDYTSTTYTSKAVTIPTVNAGDFIYFVVCYFGAQTVTVADGTNGSYTAKGTCVNGSENMQHFYMKNAAASTNLVVTATFSGAVDFVSIYAAAWSGADTTTGFDVESTNVIASSTTTTDAITSNAATTTAADLIIGVANTPTGRKATQHFTAGTGYTQDFDWLDTVTGSFHIGLVEHNVQGAAGSVAATFTDNTATDPVFVMMMAVKPLVTSTGIPYCIGGGVAGGVGRVVG